MVPSRAAITRTGHVKPALAVYLSIITEPKLRAVLSQTRLTTLFIHWWL